MALLVPYLSFLFIFVLLALVVKNVGMKFKKPNSTFNIPKGPTKLPFIGNIHNLVLSSQPHRKLRDLARKYGPLMHLQLGEISTIVISSPDYAREVMKTHDINFTIRPRGLASKIISYNSKGIVTSPYGDYWRQLRKICNSEILSLKCVNSHQPIREEEPANLVKWIASEQGSPINLTQAVTSTIYTIASKAAFGKKCKGQEVLISAVKEIVKITGVVDLVDLFPSITWMHYFTSFRPNLERVHRQTDQILENIINEHKEAKSKTKYEQSETDEDLVDVLIKYEDGNNMDFFLTIDNMKAIIMDIFAGGGETSARTINSTMIELVRNPRIMKKAQAEVREVFKMKGRVDENCMNELNYLKSIVKETLRLHPPAPLLLPRECGQACEINGYHIPTKTNVIINAWAMARDPNYWTEPERFYPERFIDSTLDYKGRDFEYLPFGAGRRICPGITFGVRNAETALATLLYHFDWKLPNGIKSEELNEEDDLLLLPFFYDPLSAM